MREGGDTLQPEAMSTIIEEVSARFPRQSERNIHVCHVSVETRGILKSREPDLATIRQSFSLSQLAWQGSGIGV